MYYEEKMIGGRLRCRATPSGEWKDCSIEKAWDKISELQNQIIDLKACLRTCANSAQGGLDQYT